MKILPWLLMAWMTGLNHSPVQNEVRQTVVDHLPKATQTYVGSPSITLLPDGTLLASHDVFGPASGKNITEVFASPDGGATWQHRSQVAGQFWSTLFVHRGAVYLIGPAKEFGPVVIRRSRDGGRTWTEPADAHHGMLLEGKFHTAPTPIVEYGGRIWRAMEDIGGPGAWPTHFRSFMLSAPAGADLLEAASWRRSNAVASDQSWLNGKFNGWLEGNAVVLPEGGVGVLLRVDAKPMADCAALATVSTDGRTESFDPASGMIRMPGGSVKFTVRRDPRTEEYWAITNVLPENEAPPNPGIVRNTLALIHSRDLRRWKIARLLWHHDDEKRYASQYVDWVFDQEDLVAVSRTANDDQTGGAHDFHDANFLTFFRVRGFRALR